ncbi:MAG: glycosyltransferase family 2 protein [Flavobacteriales bacterium]|nr:MAG: glycosyltransferase family 2 protein [Flavobacteriales bacterium]
MVDSNILQALILTKNEEPNLVRVLDKLQWLEEVIVLDSFSTDRTLEIAASYPNVRIVQRQFDTHGNQWQFGIELCKSAWILSLDADYVLSNEFIAETRMYISVDSIVAYETEFTFLVFGKPLLKDNTTPRPVLFQKNNCSYYDDGHTQRLMINGPVGRYKSKILHDDRKSFSRWLSNQDGYAIKEAAKLIDRSDEKLPLSSKIRTTKVFAPFIVFFYSLFIKGLIFNGWRGWHYTLQRTMVEMILAIRLIEEEKLNKDLD